MKGRYLLLFLDSTVVLGSFARALRWGAFAAEVVWMCHSLEGDVR